MRSQIGNLLKKLGIKKQVILALNKIGIGGFNTGDKLLDIKLLIERSSANLLVNNKAGANRKVLFAGVMPGMTEHAITSGVIGAALRLHGSDVSYFLCDGAFPTCELVHFTHFKGGDNEFLSSEKIPMCGSCFGPACAVLEMLNFPVIKASSVKTNGENEQFFSSLDNLTMQQVFEYQYKDMDLGEHVRTSVHRYHMKGILDNDDTTRRIAIKYLKSGIQYANTLISVIKTDKPDILMVTQGIYLYGGIANEVCKIYGIRFYAWDYNYRKNGIVISEGNTYHHELREEPNEYWENLVMTDEQNKIFDDYFLSRKEGKLDKDEISYTSNSILDKDEITKKVGLDSSKKIISFFTNVPWDGKVAVASNLFDGPAEMILESIDYLKDRNDIQVVIRIHPAEVLMKQWAGLQRMDTLIADKFPVLPKNLILIAPEEKISSYGLSAVSHLSVVYSTKIGLEILLQGRQVLIAGDAFYQNKGIGIKPADKEEFFKVMANINSVQQPDEEMVNRARKYAYHFFFRRTMIIPSLYKNTSETLTISDLSMLLPGKNKEVDRMCDAIITGRPFHINAE